MGRSHGSSFLGGRRQRRIGADFGRQRKPAVESASRRGVGQGGRIHGRGWPQAARGPCSKSGGRKSRRARPSRADGGRRSRRLRMAPRSLLAKSTERSKRSWRRARRRGQVARRLAWPRRRGMDQTRVSQGRCWNKGAISCGASRRSSAAGKWGAQGPERGRHQHGVAEVFELQGEDFFRPWFNWFKPHGKADALVRPDRT